MEIGQAREESNSYFGVISGAAASYKLYSKTAEGNERGNNAVTVTSPLAP